MNMWWLYEDGDVGDVGGREDVKEGVEFVRGCEVDEKEVGGWMEWVRGREDVNEGLLDVEVFNVKEVEVGFVEVEGVVKDHSAVEPFGVVKVVFEGDSLVSDMPKPNLLELLARVAFPFAGVFKASLEPLIFREPAPPLLEVTPPLTPIPKDLL